MYLMTNDEIKAYLNRIGIKEIQPPTKSYLFELHKAHVKAVAWQTIDIIAGRPASIEFQQSIALIISGRSGYCFHLNGAFSVLLRSLGYKVQLHRAGVQPLGTEPRINSFHLGLSVQLLNDWQEEETWIVDVGLGDMPFEPLPLRFATYEQAPFTYKVTASSLVNGGWRLEHDPLASVVGADFDPTPMLNLEEFMPKHEYYSRSPESPWMNMFLIKNRNETEGNELRGCIWKKIDQEGITRTEIRTKSVWIELLAEQFGEKLVNYSNLEKEQLWKRVQADHVEWKKSSVK